MGCRQVQAADGTRYMPVNCEVVVCIQNWHNISHFKKTRQCVFRSCCQQLRLVWEALVKPLDQKQQQLARQAGQGDRFAPARAALMQQMEADRTAGLMFCHHWGKGGRHNLIRFHCKQHTCTLPLLMHYNAPQDSGGAPSSADPYTQTTVWLVEGTSLALPCGEVSDQPFLLVQVAERVEGVGPLPPPDKMVWVHTCCVRLLGWREDVGQLQVELGGWMYGGRRPAPCCALSYSCAISGR